MGTAPEVLVEEGVKAAVSAAGAAVNGEFEISHQWNTTGAKRRSPKANRTQIRDVGRQRVER